MQPLMELMSDKSQECIIMWLEVNNSEPKREALILVISDEYKYIISNAGFACSSYNMFWVRKYNSINIDTCF